MHFGNYVFLGKFRTLALCDSFPPNSAVIARIRAVRNLTQKILSLKDAVWPNTFQMVFRSDPDYGLDMGNLGLGSDISGRLLGPIYLSTVQAMMSIGYLLRSH